MPVSTKREQYLKSNIALRLHYYMLTYNISHQDLYSKMPVYKVHAWLAALPSWNPELVEVAFLETILCELTGKELSLLEINDNIRTSIVQ